MNGLPLPAAPALGGCAWGSGRKVQYLYLIVNKIPEREKQNTAGRLDIKDIRVAAAQYGQAVAGIAPFHGVCVP